MPAVSGRKLGRDLVVGDCLDTWCGAKTITHFEVHPGLTDGLGVFHSARIACSGEWGMTIFDDDWEDVFACGR